MCSPLKVTQGTEGRLLGGAEDERGFALHTAWMPDLLGGSQVHYQTKENTKTGN